MDVEDPGHLERLRAIPAIKAACLVHRPEPGSPTVRFERAAKNDLYWAPIDELVNKLLLEGRVEDQYFPQAFYGQPCTLLAVSLKPGSAAPFAVAVVETSEWSELQLAIRIRAVTGDYWFGSYFFK